MVIRTIDRTSGRFYYEESAPDVKYPSVTSIVGMVPKPFLQYWAAGMTAELALDSLDYVGAMAERDREGAFKFLKGAASRYTRSRAKAGSEAHDLFERQIRGQYVGRVSRDMEPYRVAFDAFLQEAQPRLIRAEDVAWSDTHGYAGSFDAVVELMLNEHGRLDPRGEPARLMVDWKTSKAAYAEVALQMSGYAHADMIIAPDGTAERMPTFDGAGVLHITPTAAKFLPVRIDRESVFAHFLSLRHTYDWVNGLSKHVLGDPIWAYGGEPVTGTQRRAAS